MTDRISPPSSPQDSNTTGSINEKLNSPITPENKRVSIIANSGKSFADRKMSRRLSTAPTGPPIVESGNDGLTRDVNHSLPGDGLRNNRKSKTQGELAKRRSSYYEEAFQGDREANVMKDRVYGEAIVMVELRTNVIISDEFSFITDFSYQLSVRYQRPVSSIVVSLQHGACMLFGGTFDPAYTMTIHALPCEVGITKNKRNTALLQKHLQEAIGVAPVRGFLKFMEVPAENMAVNSKTMASHIAEMTGEEEETIAERRARNRKSISAKSVSALRHGSIAGGRKGSIFDFRRESVAAPRRDSVMPPPNELTPPHSATDAPPIPAIPEQHVQNAVTTTTTTTTSDEKDTPVREVEKAATNNSNLAPTKKTKAAKRKSSFVTSLFSRTPRNTPPPMPTVS
ncbi:mif domain-containing protein [Colletotrichum karsti]|uniref:L-dopachrome isomerase n=1 Tax=Colletotrichum karsti TaxID=1095194 RepID=A0A9P6LFZ7_9PEZI|nr:mif domain-containing protein [Colletotrichum karsti]KAF9871666.1 mif domain-containing protein [Colletotrichum karsti]